MTTKLILPTLLVVALLSCQAKGTEPEARLLAPIDTEVPQTGGKDKTEPPDKDKKPIDKKSPDSKQSAEPSSNNDLFNQGSAMGSQFPTGFNPQMMGDLGILFARQNVTVKGLQIITRQTTVLQYSEGPPPTIPPPTTTNPVSQTRTLLVPFASLGAFKVAENESPRPTDRVFGFYNYFDGIHGIGNGPPTSTYVPGTPQTFTDNFGNVLSVKTDVRTVFNATPSINGNLNREVFGFEKTFLDGRASIEIRVPFLQGNSDFNGFSGQNVGDITIVSKYAFLLDNQTGNVISGGLAITAPTGPSIDTVDGSLHETLIQPWFGYIRNFDNFYIQGIHSVVVPTDPHDVTMLFNDIGLNYWLYRGAPDQFLSSIVPLAEVHVTTPLNHRNQDGAIFVPDQVIFTSGVHFGIMRNTTLSIGVATPVTGPSLYHIEGFAQLNRRF